MSSPNSQQTTTANTLLIAIGISLLLAIVFVNVASPANLEPTGFVPATATSIPSPTPVPTSTPLPTATSTPLPTATTVPPTSTPQLVAEDTGAAVDRAFDPDLVSQGESLFMSSCVACHGPDARGLPNLGKNLVESEFVPAQSDEELLTFIKTGRPIWDPANTTGIDMPAKGGNPILADDDINAIIAFLRSLAAASGGATQPETAPEVVADTGGAVDGAFDPALVSQGESLFMSSCVACHGPDARGLPSLGKNLVEGDFVPSQTDEELLTFVKTGRPIWDAANTSGIDMPAKGGNPILSDDDINAIIVFLRSLAAGGG